MPAGRLIFRGLDGSTYYTQAEKDASDAAWKETPQYKAEQQRVATRDTLRDQILAQGKTDKWTGEGHGSPQANASAMADILTGIGINRLEDFGRVPTYEPVQVMDYSLNGQTVYENPGHGFYMRSQTQNGWDDQGNPYYPARYLSAAETQQLQPKTYGKAAYDPEYGSVLVPVAADQIKNVNGQMVTQTGETYGNKVTGQVVPNTYSERQTGNAWGGTFAGDGNTGFRVTFNELGMPVFYTTEASSSDWGAISGILSIASMIPGPWQPFAAAANAIGNAVNGNTTGAILSAISAAGSFGTQYGTIDPSSANAINGMDAASDAASGVTASAGTSLANFFAENAGAIQTTQQAVSVLNALDKGNVAGVINGLMNIAPQIGVTIPSDLVKPVAMAATASAISKGDWTGALDSARIFVDNPTFRQNAQLAAQSAQLVSAIQSGDPARIFSSAVGFAQSNSLGASAVKGAAQQAGIAIDDVTADALISSPDAEHYANSLVKAKEKDPDFNPLAYLKGNSDLLQAFGSDNVLAGIDHYANYGIDEGRTVDTWAEVAAILDPNFDAKAYADRYGDLKEAFGDDTDALARHFAQAGQSEGRQPNSVDYYAKQAGFPDYETQQKYGNDVKAYEAGKYDDEFGDYQGAIDKNAAQKDKISFADAFAGARNLAALTGQDPKTATFSWTNPNTGVTGVYKANTADEINAQLAADQKRIDLMPVYGGSENTRTGRPAGKETVYIDTKTGDVVNDDRVFDEMGNVISGSIELANNDTKVAALQTAVGSSIRTALDIGAGLIKGGAGVIEGAGTFAGLLGADMDNILRSTGKSAQEAVESFRSNEFKADQKLMNDAIKKAGGEGNFAQAMETLIQFGTNPVQAAAFIAEQGVSLLVGGGAMTAARALGAGLTVAEAASLTANAVLQGASVASETYDEKKKQGATEDEAKNAARVAGSLSGFVSAVANKYIPGAMSGEAMVATQTAAAATLKAALKGEMSSELVEETVGKVIGNIATGKAWDSDLGTTAVQALIGSGATTGLVHTTYSALDPVQSTPPSKFDGVTSQEFDAALNGASSQGYTPSISELADIINSAPDSSAADIGKYAEAYADQRVVSTDEATQMLADLGYQNPTPEQIDQFVGVKSEDDVKAAADQWVNSNTVSREEARQQLIDLGYSNPPENLIDKLVGQYEESQLTTKAEGLGVATKSDIDAAIAGIQFPAGLSKTDVANAISDYMKANPGLSLADVSSKIADATKGLATTEGVNTAISDALKTQSDSLASQISDVQKSLSDEIQAAKDIGLEGDAALQAGLDSLAKKMGANQDDLLKQMGTTAEGLKTQFAADLATSQAATSTEIANTKTALEAAIADAKTAGLEGDQALKFAIDKVAADQNTSAENLLSKIGATETSLKSEFAAGLQGVQTQISDVQKSLSDEIKAAKDIGLEGDAALQAGLDSLAQKMGVNQADLLAQLGSSVADLKTQFASDLAGVAANVADTKAALEAAIADAKAAGLEGDLALQSAIEKVAADQNTSSADLLSKIGATEESLKSEFATGLAGVSADVAATRTALETAIKAAQDMGLKGDAALQAAIDSVAADQKTSSADLLSKLGTTEAALRADMQAGLAGVTANVADTKAALEAAIADAKAAGLSGDQALQSAIDKVASDQKTSSADLLAKLGTTEAGLKSEFASGLAGVSADVAATRTALEDAIKAATDIGLKGDAALQAAIDSVAADQNLSKSELLAQLGTTEQALRTDFAAGLSGLSQQMTDQYNALTAAQKAEVDARMQQGADMQTAMAGVQSALQQQISGVDARLQEAIATNEAAGLSRDQAISKAVDDVAASVGSTRADLLSQMGATEQSILAKFQAGQAETAGQIAGLSQEMQQQYAAMTAAQKAEVDARVKQGQDLQAAIGTVQQSLSGQVAGVESRLTDAIAAAEAMGLSRDQAITAAVESVASELNTTKESLLAQMGTSEAALRAQFASGLAGVSEQVRQQYESLTAAQKAEADARVAQGATLEQAIAASQQQTSTQIAGAEARLQEAIATNEAAGLSRDQAITKAVDDVAASVGTTRTDLLAQMGTTEANLLAKFQAGQTNLQEQIAGLGQSTDARIAELMRQGASYQQATQQAFAEVNAQNRQLAGQLGTQGRAANQSDIDVLTQMVAGQVSPDTAYDVNGDKQITQADIDFLTGVVSNTNTNWRPTTGPWAATGLYGQMQTNEWKRQDDLAAAKAAQDAKDAEAARQAAEQQKQAAFKAKVGEIGSQTQRIADQFPAAAKAAQTTYDPIYGGIMQDFDLGSPLDVGFFGPRGSNQAGQNKGQTAKIATGGYLDDLLDLLR